MQNITDIARAELDLIKERLADTGKHIIKTETLKSNIMAHVPLNTEDENELYLIDVGIVQVAQSVLWADGWRSVADGYFASLHDCKDLVQLKLMLKNSDRRVESAVRINGEVKMYESRQLKIAGLDCDELVAEPSYEDLIADLEADAV